jgi:hypothetical protein
MATSWCGSANEFASCEKRRVTRRKDSRRSADLIELTSAESSAASETRLYATSIALRRPSASPCPNLWRGFERIAESLFASAAQPVVAPRETQFKCHGFPYQPPA